MMAFEFLGGAAHCGRPVASLRRRRTRSSTAPTTSRTAPARRSRTCSTSSPARTHDPVGWPTFKDWPHHKSLTHEQLLLQVARAGLDGRAARVREPARGQRGALRALSAQAQQLQRDGQRAAPGAGASASCRTTSTPRTAGPGKGWFRIVDDPFQARRVINQGKLAVVLGIEVSKLFDCGVYNDVPECDRAQIDRQLDEVHRLGVRDMELVNKFDNALSGVAGDSGDDRHGGERRQQVRDGPVLADAELRRRQPRPRPRAATAPGAGRDALAGNGFQAFLPPGADAGLPGSAALQLARPQRPRRAPRAAA